MSDYSIEHSLVFNTAKRILKFVAPDFRVIARDDILDSGSSLDLRLKILEVPEGLPFRAVGIVIFNAGLLRLKNDERFSSVFGKIPAFMTDKEAIQHTAKQHAEADQEAFLWAKEVILSHFPELEEARAISLVDHRVSYEGWLKYFSS